MKNAWALFDPKTKKLIGAGTGHLDTDMIGSARVVWRDTYEEVNMLPGVALAIAQHNAASQMALVSETDRAQAKSRKADSAARFLNDVAEPATIDPADPDSIPGDYVELFDEYWQTYDINTTATNPWHLAKLIVQKAREKNIVEMQAASMEEARIRREKVLAEITLNKQPPPIPDE